MMDTATRRATLRMLSNGMYVMTARSSDRYGAATVTWLSQASFNPPLIMAAVRGQSSVFQCLEQSGAVAVHILGIDQQEIARTIRGPLMLKAEQRRENSSSYCCASPKRMIDIVAAGLGLVLLAPALLVIAILIRLTMGHPVLFRHVRAGLMGKPFTLYKFRTMRDAYGPDGRPLPDAERLTRLGRNLRRTSLDELPQLWNVLRGDMSLVGPRPLLMEYLPRYTPEQARRHRVRPGITGWAQVNGRNSLPWEEKFRQDIWYVDHQSLWIDAKIIVMTIIRVVQRRGISHNNHATAPEFVPTHRAHEGD